MLRAMNIKRTDMRFSEHGDFIIRHGDIQDTLNLQGLGFIEEVEIRIKSSFGDWYFNENKGANLSDFEGQMITPGLIERIREAVSNSLTDDDFIVPSDFRVEMAVIDINEVAVKIVFSDNIKKTVDYRIQDVRIIFDLRNATPRIVRS